MRVTGVLLDMGGTLTRPVGGRWNPRADFEDVLACYYPHILSERFPEAFAAGQAFLDGSATTPPRADYHRSILRVLGIDNPDPALLAELERPLETCPVEPYPEAAAVLAELAERRVRLALVTDNWGTSASVRRMLDQVGLAAYFEAFIVSQEVGCNKPDPRIFLAASGALRLEPSECLFVDDDPDLVAAAVDLGYQGVALCRPGASQPGSTPWIPSLDALLERV